MQDKRVDSIIAKRRRDTRTGCMAMLQIRQSNGGDLVVEKFSDAHNHAMISTPSKVIKFRSHSKSHLLEACGSLVSKLNQAGFSSSKISKVVNVINDELSITSA